MTEKETIRIEKYLDDQEITWHEDYDFISYDIGNSQLIMGVGDEENYALDDRTNRQFRNLEEIIEFYSLPNKK